MPETMRKATKAAHQTAATAAKSAARAKDRVDFSTTALTGDSNFDNFEDHPETAVMLGHLNLGYDRFRDLDALMREPTLAELNREFEALPEAERTYWQHRSDQLLPELMI